MTPQAIEKALPGLTRAGYLITSPATQDYNCIAWAAGDTENWWWPGPLDETFWPPAAPRKATLEAFVAAYATVSFVRCESGDAEPGVEKVAIYVDASGTPTHAARQLDDGAWTSKLGPAEDICHVAVDGVEGDIYGRVACFMARRRI